MSRIVLLHGFAVHLTSPIVRPPFGPSASFSALDDLVTTGDATVFPWGIQKHIMPWQFLNPHTIHNLYQEEFDLVHSPKLQSDLHSYLEQEQPAMIVCHSMGCSLLQRHLETYSLPESVQVIIMIQSDLLARIPINTSLPICHLYCPWDPTLILSSILNRSLRAGLWKSKRSNVINTFFPLIKLSNLHTSSIRDKKLIDLVNSISSSKNADV